MMTQAKRFKEIADRKLERWLVFGEPAPRGVALLKELGIDPKEAEIVKLQKWGFDLAVRLRFPDKSEAEVINWNAYTLPTEVMWAK